MFCLTTLTKTNVAARDVAVGATHPQHKATKLMNHRRPKKTNPSDKNRKPCEYAELPTPPPEFKVVSKK